jgi:uncharacterized protein YecE (DUF72 family)
MGWSYTFWIDSFYPKSTKSAQFLTEYAKHFDTVEVDATFYRNPSKDTLLKWRAQTPEQFLFSAKFPRRITHQKMLVDCEEETRCFLQNMTILEDNLGPLLLQLPPQFKPERLNILKDFLATLPSDRRFAVEVRSKRLLQDRLHSILRQNNIALAVTDRLFTPKTVKLTADFAYMRWEGDRTAVNGTLGKVEVDRTDDIKAWADTVKSVSNKGTEVFGYFSKYFSGHPPTDVRTFFEQLE